MEILFLTVKIIILIAVIWALLKSKCEEKGNSVKKPISREILLILFGFLLVLITDSASEFQLKEKEKDTIVTILKMELAQIHATVNVNLVTIDKNIEILAKNKQVITPLILLDTAAWESAKLRNSVFIKETADLFSLVNLYSSIYVLNEKIRYREHYRISNEAMTNYNQRLSKIDGQIKETILKIKPYLKNAQVVLDKIHVFKVKGRSFSLNKHGIVNQTIN